MAVSYVVYIDESGDPGLGQIKAGGSQWFVLSGIVVREHHVATLGNVHAKILSQFKNRQTNFIHFNRLTPHKKFIACQELAKAPCKAFAVISNKTNILTYRNPHLASNKDWVYWFLTRLLLERVTDMCLRDSIKYKIPSPKIRIIFSRRGINDYEEFKRYLLRLQSQSKAGGLYLNAGDLSWDVYDPDEIHIVDAKNSVGLEMADIAAGAIYNGLETGTRQHNINYTRTLLPILAKKDSRLFKYGIKTMPSVCEMSLNQNQKDFFRMCDFRGRWTPGS